VKTPIFEEKRLFFTAILKNWKKKRAGVTKKDRTSLKCYFF